MANSTSSFVGRSSSRILRLGDSATVVVVLWEFEILGEGLTEEGTDERRELWLFLFVVVFVPSILILTDGLEKSITDEESLGVDATEEGSSKDSKRLLFDGVSIY